MHEYEVCAAEYGFGTDEFSAMNRAVLRHSFLPEEMKARVEEEL